jgi:electron transport complex protein RnfB
VVQSGAPQRIPKKLAVINADHCTGCEACVEVCPVDCIRLITRGLGVKGSESWCEIDLELCIGCELCVRLPRRKGDPYELQICPWDAIEIVPTEQVADHVLQMGGPPDYVAEHREHQLDVARKLKARQLDSRL